MVLANPDTAKPKLTITVGGNGINTIQEYCNPYQSGLIGLGHTIILFVYEKDESSSVLAKGATLFL